MNAEDKLRKARIKLQEKSPFFGYLVLHLDLKEDSEKAQHRAGVDKFGNLYFDSDFINGLSDGERVGLVMHEVSHVAFMHLGRLKGRDRQVWNWACLIPDTGILLSNGNSKKIKNITEDDEILGINKNGDIIPNKINKKISKETKEIVKIKFGNSEVKCTQEHKFLTDNGFVEAKDLNMEDYIYVGGKKYDKMPLSKKQGLHKEKLQTKNDSKYSKKNRCEQGDCLELYSKPERFRFGQKRNIEEKNIQNFNGFNRNTKSIFSGINRWRRNNIYIQESSSTQWKNILQDSIKNINYKQGISREIKKLGIFNFNFKKEKRGLVYRFLFPNYNFRSFKRNRKILGHKKGTLFINEKIFKHIDGFGMERRLSERTRKNIQKNKEIKRKRIKQIQKIQIKKGDNQKVFDLNTELGNYILDNGAIVHNSDITVNNIIKEDGFQLPRGGWDPNDNKIKVMGHWIENLSDKSAEQVYDELMNIIPKGKNKKQIKGKGDKSKQGKDNGVPKGFDVHIHKGEKEDAKTKDGEDVKKEAEKLKEKWKGLVTEAATYAKQRGKLPAGLERRVDELMETKLNWKQILYKYITNTIPFDYSYSIPHKKSRSIGVYMPSVKKENLEVGVVIDTSGSISEEELAQFVGVLKGIVNSFSSVNITAVIGDAEVQKVIEINRATELVDFDAPGGGGTNMPKLERWFKENKPRTRIVITITDGHTPYSERQNWKQLWVLTKKGKPIGDLPNHIEGVKMRC